MDDPSAIHFEKQPENDVMASPKSPRLPVELQELILESLIPFDPEEVRLFALVCQHWRLRIYRHTFAHVCLDQSTVQPFTRLVDSPFSCLGILPAVSSFHVETRGYVGVGYCLEADLLALQIVLAKVAQWSRVTSMVLSKDVVGGCTLGLPKSAVLSFPFLTTLSLRRITFRSPQDFIGFFYFFPALKHVDFDDVRCPWPTELQSKLPSGDFMLALVVQSVSAHRTTIKWTLDDPVSSIEPADLYSLGSLTRADIRTLLCKIGPSLRELDIDFQLKHFQGSLLEHLVNALDLSVTPHLRHIRIGSSIRVLSFMHWVPRVLYGLSKIKHPCLNILEIRFASSRQFHLDRPFLRSLTLGLEQPQYSAIKKIHFIAYHDNPFEFDKDVEHAITQTIQNDLLRWHEQGLIGLTFCLRER